MKNKRSVPKKALVVESNETLRQFIGTFLSAGFEVASARSGLEAMACMGKGFIPDIIITDTQVTDLTGAAFLVNLRNSGLFGSIPVVAIGEADREEEEQFRSLGVSDYFPKPFNPIQLHDRIIQILG
jgi:CheY-like chemotaxis protein